MSLLSSFAGSNENPLSEGGNWTQLTLVSGSGNLQLTSNTVKGTTAATINDACWTPTTLGPDTYIRAKVSTIPSSGRYIRLYLGLSATSGFAAGSVTGYFMQYENGSNGVRIFKANGATLTQIASNASAGIANGAVITFTRIGSLLEVYYNGAVVLSVTDTTYTAAGYVGIGAGDATAVLDDVYAGTVPTGTTYEIANTASDITPSLGFGMLNGVLDTASNSAFDLNGSVNAADQRYCYGITVAGSPGAGGGTLGFYRLVVAAYGGVANGDFALSLQLNRINSSGVVQNQTGFSQPLGITNTSGFGTTYVFGYADPDLGTWAAGDRLQIDIKLRNQTLAGRTIHVEVQGTNTKMLVPFTPSTAYTDADTATLKFTPSGVDTPSGDFDTVRLALTPGGSDIHEYSDVGTVVILKLASGVAVVESLDSGTLPLKLTPSGSDVGPATDAATERLALIPSGVDIGPYSDLGTIPLKLTPAQAGVHVDTVPLYLRPSGAEVMHQCLPRFIGEIFSWNTDDITTRWFADLDQPQWDGELVVEAVVNHEC